MSRTTAEKAAAREGAREDRAEIVKRYRDGESMTRLATDYGVTSGWLALRFDEWKEPRRDFRTAHLIRRTPRPNSRDGGPLPRRTKAEVTAARTQFIEQRETVVKRYQDGESAASLAESFGVSGTWVAEQFDAWGVPRRDRSAAAVVRGPGVRPL
ncbi:hypothetical protein AB0903_29910 [Streptomyces sp. NPDC048389]|uniref:hypothetical protein n=1 Tax=Streptomyces sp. NPDC048389 TaxID=3154622 RepID=UPI003457103C